MRASCRLVLSGLLSLLLLAAVQAGAGPAVAGGDAAQAPADRLDRKLAIAGFVRGAPILLRAFKKEARLEVWMMRAGRFALFESYPICNWDGRLGPKIREGDHQSPEGFYTVSESQLRWTGRWHRAFDLGFPNAYDQALGRSGSGLLIHGACSSIGCYAMTNGVIDEIFDLAAAAMASGQSRFAVHAFPFALSEASIAAQSGSPWQAFWRELMPAARLLETTGLAPRIGVCDGRYVVAEGTRGYDGGAPLRPWCHAATGPGLLAGAGAGAAPPAPASESQAPPPSQRLLDYVRLVAEGRKPILAWPLAAPRGRKGVSTASFDPGVLGEASAGGPALQVRCNRGLPSCRKWIALQSAKLGRTIAGDPGRARRVRVAKAAVRRKKA